MKGEISDNYIHNCLWSGISATGSHDLKIQKNKITFTTPKELSISVGIWTVGGTGIISENHITSYKAVDYHPPQKTITGSDLWPASFQFTEPKEYRVIDNIFEQSAAGTQFSNMRMVADKPYRSLQRKSMVYSNFINVVKDNIISEHSGIVMLPPD